LLGVSDNLEGISKATRVSYQAVSYHKRHLERQAAYGLDIRVHLDRPRAVGPIIEEVCYPKQVYIVMKVLRYLYIRCFSFT
jgi:hypothetical protein